MCSRVLFADRPSGSVNVFRRTFSLMCFASRARQHQLDIGLCGGADQEPFAKRLRNGNTEAEQGGQIPGIGGTLADEIGRASCRERVS
jgi:hypothetical protein